MDYLPVFGLNLAADGHLLAHKYPNLKLRKASSRAIDPDKFECHSHGSLVPTVMNPAAQA
jgi:hypothetical protein